MPASTRVDWLDFAKGASVLLVVVFHASIALDSHDLTNAFYWKANTLLVPVRMPVFFVASGVFAAAALSRGWADVLSRKVYHFLYIFVLWSVIHLAYSTLAPFMTTPRLHAWLVFPVSPSSVLWFVWALAIYFVLAKLVWTSWRLPVLVAAIGLSIAGYSDLFHFPNYAHNNLLKYFSFFIFGAWYGRAIIAFFSKNYMYVLPIALGLFFVVFFTVYGETDQGVDVGALRFVRGCLGVMVGFSLALLLCRVGFLRRPMTWFGRNTLYVYVAHAPMIDTLAIEGALFRDVPGADLWAVPALTFGAVALSLLIRYVALSTGATWLYAPPPIARSRSAKVA